jgi:hypothetical protein
VGTWYLVDLWAGVIYTYAGIFVTLSLDVVTFVRKGKRRQFNVFCIMFNHVLYHHINYTDVPYFNTGFLYLQPIKSTEKLFPLDWLHN